MPFETDKNVESVPVVDISKNDKTMNRSKKK